MKQFVSLFYEIDKSLMIQGFANPNLANVSLDVRLGSHHGYFLSRQNVRIETQNRLTHHHAPPRCNLVGAIWSVQFGANDSILKKGKVYEV